MKKREPNSSAQPTKLVRRKYWALLQGIVLCGRCGRRMSVRYLTDGQIPSYECNQLHSHFAGRTCSFLQPDLGSPELLAQEIRQQLRSGLNASSIFITVLSRRPVKRIEEQRERRLRLRAVLRTQAEQDDAARIHFDDHDRRPPRHPLFAAQPARG
jgi:hypothetical protein